MPKKSSDDLTKKVRRCIRYFELGKRNYARHRDLLQEICTEITPGTVIDLGDGRKATLIDNFADSITKFKPLGFSKYEFEVKNA